MGHLVYKLEMGNMHNIVFKSQGRGNLGERSRSEDRIRQKVGEGWNGLKWLGTEFNGEPL